MLVLASIALFPLCLTLTPMSRRKHSNPPLNLVILLCTFLGLIHATLYTTGLVWFFGAHPGTFAEVPPIIQQEIAQDYLTDLLLLVPWVLRKVLDHF
jgi:hypothetical protein